MTPDQEAAAMHGIATNGALPVADRLQAALQALEFYEAERTRHEGIGVTPHELTPGTAVMVPVGQLAAVVNGGPCIIAWAVVRGPASETDAASFIEPATMYWLDVYMIPGGPPLPQMYRADAILGVPALGLQIQRVQPTGINDAGDVVRDIGR